jgi:hypothetical protein
MLPQRDTFLNVYKVLSLNLLPSKIKETTVQTLNKTIWEGNKAYKSGMALDPICQYCEELDHETPLIRIQTTQPIYGQ